MAKAIETLTSRLVLHSALWLKVPLLARASASAALSAAVAQRHKAHGEGLLQRRGVRPSRGAVLLGGGRRLHAKRAQKKKRRTRALVAWAVERGRVLCLVLLPPPECQKGLVRPARGLKGGRVC